VLHALIHFSKLSFFFNWSGYPLRANEFLPWQFGALLVVLVVIGTLTPAVSDFPTIQRMLGLQTPDKPSETH